MWETDKDVSNIEAWAEVILNVMHLVPPDNRLAVLAVVQHEEEEQAAKRAATPGPVLEFIDFSDEGVAKFLKSPGIRHWHTIMRLMSLVVQVFTRRITNNNSEQDAAKLLFSRHPHGHGSRLLADYLPRPTA